MWTNTGPSHGVVGGGMIVAAKRWRGRRARVGGSGDGRARALERDSTDVLELKPPSERRAEIEGEVMLVVNGRFDHQSEGARAVAAAPGARGSRWNGSNGRRLLNNAEPISLTGSSTLSLPPVKEMTPQMIASRGVDTAVRDVGSPNQQIGLDRQAEVEVPEKAGGMEFNGSLTGMLMLNLGAMLFGSNQVVIKSTEALLEPGALSAIRFAIAAVCFTPWILKGLQNKKMLRPATELAGWLFGGYTAQALGLFTTTAARGAFTGTFMVIAVPILVGLSGRKISWNTWIAAVGALFGVGLLTSSGADPNIGDAWCILSAILFGVHKWRSEAITAEFEETNELVSLQILALAVMSALYVAPDAWHLLQNNTVQEIMDKAAGLPWLSLAYMGLGTTALSLYLEMASLKEVSAPLAAVIYTAEPLWGAAFAYYFLNERWGATGWFGAALIVGSSLFSQFSGDSEKLENTALEKEKLQ